VNEAGRTRYHARFLPVMMCILYGAFMVTHSRRAASWLQVFVA